MENLVSFLNNHTEIKEITSYFSCELVLLMGVIVNLILLIFRKKINVRKMSTNLTICTFGLNILLLIGVCLWKCFDFTNFSAVISYRYFEPNDGVLFLKILINAFMMFFVVVNRNDIKKFAFRVPVLNSISLLLAICGCLIVRAGSYIVAYILLEAVSIFVYKFASNMRIKKLTTYSRDFIILSASATVIFLGFYIIGFKTDKTIQMSIIYLGLSIAVMMKMGLFPFYNFLILKSSRRNLPFSELLFCYLPWMGVLAFSKMSNNIVPSDEIYQISMIAFILASLITFSFYASKHKNLIKFLANFSFFINGLCILSIVYFQANPESVWLSTMFSFGLISLYSLITILQNNLKLEKIYIANLKGIFLNNRLFALLFSGLLIMMTGLIPNGIMCTLLKTLKNIYIYDKTGFLAICAIVVLMLLILFNCLKIVQQIYTFNMSGNSAPKFTKRTTLNYVVPVVVMIFLLLKTVL